MRLLRTTTLSAIVLIAFRLVTPSIALAEQPDAKLTSAVASLFKDPASITLTNLVLEGRAGMRVVCGRANDQPFRILTHPDGRIDNPMSFMVSDDADTARYVVLLCGDDRSNASH